MYRARDTKLQRDVALKVLPELFALEPDRLARFQREAQLLASLNHPNIAAIHGFEETDGIQALVLELVEGPTLAERIAQGSVPIDDALPIASQIAEALEAAHERGIIHRDLKPSNIKLRPDGTVKVLDFGLAKALEDPLPAIDMTQSPTLSAAATRVGVLLGTAGYMSPEQARGKPVDKRADVWAFGCVLFEMLSGKRAFTGSDVSDTLAGILRSDPDWKALPEDTPPAIRRLLRRCLQKEAKDRLHDIADARIELQEARLQGESETRVAMPLARPTHVRIAWTAAAVCAVLAAGLLLRATYFAPVTAAPLVSRFAIDLPPDAQLGTAPAEPLPSVSPDGRFVVFRMTSPTGFRLWLRPIGSLTAQPIAGTEGITPYPFWSPDSRYIGFFAGGKLKKVAVDGGPPQVLTDGVGPGGTWNQDDVVLFDGQGVIRRVSAAGGASTVIRTPDKTRNEVAYSWPSLLPDGRHFLYVASSVDPGRTEIRVAALDGGTDTALFNSNSRVLYANPNHLLFVRDGTLMAQPFDPQSLTLSGAAFPVAESVGTTVGTLGGVILTAAAFGVASNGTLVHRLATAAAATELTWFDRAGKKLGTAPSTGVFTLPVFAPDQTHVVGRRLDGGVGDLWILDVKRGTSSRFTFDPADDGFGGSTFSRDGTQVAFPSNRGGAFGLYVKPASGVGAEQLLQKFPAAILIGAADWSPDGKLLLANVQTPDSGWDVVGVPLGGDRKPFPILNEKYNEYRSRLSPDGRWMLYTSNETGRNEIYVQTFPPSGGKWQISTNGGEYGYWRRDGSEIIFDAPDQKIMAVDVRLGTTFEASIPHPLFELPVPAQGVRIGMTADAQRFLVPLPVRSVESAALRVVLNWAAEIKR